MADTFSIGLPNQALKALTSTFQSTVNLVTPLEVTLSASAGGGVETDVITVQTVASNKKAILDSLLVTASVDGSVFRVYRGSTIVTAFTVATADTEYQVFADGIGKEFDEAETWKVTVFNAAAVDATASASGRLEMKRNELFSQVLA